MIKVPAAFRFVAGVFGLVFFGIGLTVISFLNGVSDSFDSPPAIFRIFGSGIGLCFMAFGGTMAFSAITGGGLMKAPEIDTGALSRLQQNLDSATKPISPSPGSYICPACGATLQKADVSPMGDVKCGHCGQWFNVHGKR